VQSWAPADVNADHGSSLPDTADAVGRRWYCELSGARRRAPCWARALLRAGIRSVQLFR